MAGLDSTGFTPKTLSEIKEELKTKVKTAFGTVDPVSGEVFDIDVSPSSRFGQLIDIMASETESTWLALQDIYNQRYPDTATGNNLDNVFSITNIFRKPASSGTANAYMFSPTPNITISSGQTCQKDKTGETEIFTSSSNATIGDTCSVVYLPDVADAGNVRLSFQGIPMVDVNDDAILIEYNDSPTEIADKLKAFRIGAVNPITGVIVTGSLDTTGAIHMQFTATTLTSIIPTFVEKTVLEEGEAIPADAVLGLSKYGEPLAQEALYSTINQESFISSEVTGDAVPALSLRKATGTNPNFRGVLNFTVGTPGIPRETSAQMRARRYDQLNKAGTATIPGIETALLNIDGVTSAAIIENATPGTDAQGRPRNSYEAYVSGGDDDAVAQTLYDSKPVGIPIVCTSDTAFKRTGEYIDVNNKTVTLDFSEPNETMVYIYIDISTINAEYPADGDTQMRKTLTDYFQKNYKISTDGNDVIVYLHSLYTPINDIPGISNVGTLKMTSTLPSDNTDASNYDVLPINVGLTSAAITGSAEIYITGGSGE